MIKSLLDEEEPEEEGKKSGGGLLGKRFRKDEFVTIDLSDDDPAPGESEDELSEAIRLGPSSPAPGNDILEIPEEPVQLPPSSEALPAGVSGRTEELEKMVRELEEELRQEIAKEGEPKKASQMGESSDAAIPRQRFGSDSGPAFGSYTSSSDSESPAETYRKSGLAWSAAIALFGSVVFMLVLGWFADVLLGSSPWGIVTGIVIGSAIGFLQFFRITSQIIRPKPSDFDRVSLRSADSDAVESLPESDSGDTQPEPQQSKE